MLVMVLLAQVAGAVANEAQEELSPESACAEIRLHISRLAKAERAQADVLELVRQGADLELVAGQLHQLLQRIAELRASLPLIDYTFGTFGLRPPSRMRKKGPFSVDFAVN